MYDSSAVNALLVSFLPSVILFFVYGIICGTLCQKLAARKGYYGYFWTGFFWSIAGLIYVAGLPMRKQ